MYSDILSIILFLVGLLGIIWYILIVSRLGRIREETIKQTQILEQIRDHHLGKTPRIPPPKDTGYL